MTNTGHLISTVQAAQILGVSVKTVRRLVERGELDLALKAEGLRGPMFYNVNDVHALAQKRASA